MKIALVGAELEENLALRSIHAAAVAAGHDAEIFDFHQRAQIDEVAPRIVDASARIVGMSMVFTARAREFVDLARELRRRGFCGHLTAGGHFASFNAEPLLRDVDAIDSVLHGEGEEALVDLAANLDEPERIAGITCRSADGRIVTTSMRSAPDDLDARPRPMRPQRFDEYLGYPIANMLSGRGCFGNCSFCSINAWHRRIGGKRFRQRRVECVAAEMADLYHARGVRMFNFHDDNFFLSDRRANIARFRELKRLLDRAGAVRIAVQVKARPDSIDDETIAALVDLGLFRVFLGVESNAVAGLLALNRGITRERNDEALTALKRAGLHVTFNLLMFEPDCTPVDLRENIAFVRRHADVPQNFCRVEVYAGTPIERRLREQGRLLGDYFGWTYRMADERCERAYRIFREVFTPRNFRFEGTNLRAMGLEYNLHVLTHFHPKKRVDDLARRIDAWIRALNGNNADLLERICAFSGSNERAFTEQLCAERIRFDEMMSARADALHFQINTAAVEAQVAGKKRARSRVGIAAAALLATALGCPQSCEMAPREDKGFTEQIDRDDAKETPAPQPHPPRPESAKEEEPAPQPQPPQVEPPPEKKPEPPAGPAAYGEAETKAVQENLQQNIVPKVQFLTNRHLKKPADVTAYIEIDAEGNVTKARCDFSPPENRTFGKTLEMYLRGAVVKGVSRAGSCNVTLRLEPGKPVAPPDGPHRFEMAPRDDFRFGELR